MVAVVHERGREKASGVEVAHRFGQVWTLRDGKIVRLCGYQDKAQALEAVGLQE